MTVRQRKTPKVGGCPEYTLTTTAGEVWEVYSWNYNTPPGVPSHAPRWFESGSRLFWHLMRPDGEHEKSFGALWQARRYLQDREAEQGATTDLTGMDTKEHGE